jgi:hypothetical protein
MLDNVIIIPMVTGVLAHNNRSFQWKVGYATFFFSKIDSLYKSKQVERGHIYSPYNITA